jgi:peptidoglycan/LPS O-acetylase OafA/YrhL
MYKINLRGRLCPSRKAIVILILLLVVTTVVIAQDGEAGIQEATDKVKLYFAKAQLLLYAIGGVIGIVGAIKVYNKWSHGDPDTNKTAAAWLGACVFLVVVATVLKKFFGL